MNKAVIHTDIPESMLTVDNRAEPGVPIDAITAACIRADAVLALLHSQFDGEHEQRVADHIVAAALWDVQGTVELIRKLAGYGYESTHPANSQRGAR